MSDIIHAQIVKELRKQCDMWEQRAIKAEAIVARIPNMILKGTLLK